MDLSPTRQKGPGFGIARLQEAAACRATNLPWTAFRRMGLLADGLPNELLADRIANLHAQFFNLTKQRSPIRIALLGIHCLPQLLGKPPNLLAHLLSLPGNRFLAHFFLLPWISS